MLDTIRTMSSREIAEITGKRHDHVMRDCKKLDKVYNRIDQPKLGVANYNDSQGKKRPMFILSKIQVMDLMTGYSLELRIKVNRRWEELENNQIALPQTYLQALKELTSSIEEKEHVKKELTESREIIKENEPKVVFAESVAGSSNSILIRKLAKDMSDDGFKIGQNRLFDWFKVKRYLQQNNEPYQQYVDQGLFEVITRVIGSGEDTFTSKTTKVTGKGVVYFTHKIKNGK